MKATHKNEKNSDALTLTLTLTLRVGMKVTQARKTLMRWATRATSGAWISLAIGGGERSVNTTVFCMDYISVV